MTTRTRALSLTLLLAGAAGTATTASGEVARSLPHGEFVLDGGTIEAAALAERAAPDPGPAEDPHAAPPVEPSLRASVRAVLAEDGQVAPAPRPRAFEYSDGYYTRLKIHKYASFAMLPLFVAQYAVGQKLYDGNASDGTRSLHGALAGTTAVLFGVNTVTGVWNLREGRKDPNHRTKRMVHGMLMLVADAGFVATGMLAPDEERERGGGGSGSASTHRTVALTSMGIATVAYLMMLIH
jgi:hypothetical protein